MFGRGGKCITYSPAVSIARVLMPPSRTRRNFGVGRAVYGISDVDVPMGGIHLFDGSPPHSTAVMSIGVKRWGDRRGPRWQHREQMTAPLLFVVGAEGGHL